MHIVIRQHTGGFLVRAIARRVYLFFNSSNQGIEANGQRQIYFLFDSSWRYIYLEWNT